MTKAYWGVGIAIAGIVAIAVFAPRFTEHRKRARDTQERGLWSAHQIRWHRDSGRFAEADQTVANDSTFLDPESLATLRRRYSDLIAERDRLPSDTAAWNQRMLPRIACLIDSLGAPSPDSLQRLRTEADSCLAAFPDLAACTQAAIAAAIHQHDWQGLWDVSLRKLRRSPMDPWARGARGVILLVGGDPANAVRWLPRFRPRPSAPATAFDNSLHPAFLARFWSPFRAAAGFALHPVDASLPGWGPITPVLLQELEARAIPLDLTTRAWTILGDLDSTRCYSNLFDRLTRPIPDSPAWEEHWRRKWIHRFDRDGLYRIGPERICSPGPWTISWPEQITGICSLVPGTDSALELCELGPAPAEVSAAAFDAALWIAKGRHAAPDSFDHQFLSPPRTRHSCPEGHPGSVPPTPDS